MAGIRIFDMRGGPALVFVTTAYGDIGVSWSATQGIQIVRGSSVKHVDSTGAAAEYLKATLTPPHVRYDITLERDGDQWCALFGDFPTSIAGFGDTTEEALAEFDKAMLQQEAES
jgi:hypothetical protein